MEKYMETKAVRLYGKNDLRLETFKLPEIKDDEILASIVSDSICMSSHKAAMQGSSHKRVPDDLSKNPVIIGHEFCGELIKVGKKWQHKFSPGQHFAIQPALNYKGSLDAPGYSYPYIGGDATNIIIPNEVMEMDCLLVYNGDSFFHGSLAEPMSCLVGAMNASYHVPQGTYRHDMGIREKGSMVILAGAGPMGLGLIDLTIHGERKPSRLYITDIDDQRLARAAALFPPEEALKHGVKLAYINTSSIKEPEKELVGKNGNSKFDDVFVMAPAAMLVEQAGRLLKKDGCMNFFAGPTNPEFSAPVNFYDIHYSFHHIVGTSGGNTGDLRTSLSLMEKGIVNPAVMITHVGGLNSAVEATLHLPEIPGGKKLIYTHIDMPLTAIADFQGELSENPLFAALGAITAKTNGLWNREAEQYLLSHAKPV